MLKIKSQPSQSYSQLSGITGFYNDTWIFAPTTAIIENYKANLVPVAWYDKKLG